VELLAAFILMDFRMDDMVPTDGALGFAGAVVGQADSMGSMFAVSKLYTGAEPGASIIRVMASKCAEKDVTPGLMWEPRATNTWADALSKGQATGFNPMKRRVVDWSRYRQIQEDFLMFSVEGRGSAQLRPHQP
jgi:hypothetical protein